MVEYVGPIAIVGPASRLRSPRLCLESHSLSVKQTVALLSSYENNNYNIERRLCYNNNIKLLPYYYELHIENTINNTMLGVVLQPVQIKITVNDRKF